jgi:hypothetical protein
VCREEDPTLKHTDESPVRPFLCRRRLALIAVVLGLGIPLLFHQFLFENNFEEVDPGLVYRSAQPKGDLEQVLNRYQIASVLNLRGGTEADWWYANEVRATRGIDFYDLPLSADRRPSRRALLVLLDLFDRCRYPLLIHCKSGSDRTGLACGLYLMSRRGVPPRRALRAFSIWNGHVPLYGPERLHDPFLEYDAYLTAHRLTHTPERLRAWVERDYRATDRAKDFTPLHPGPRGQRISQAVERVRPRK